MAYGLKALIDQRVEGGEALEAPAATEAESTGETAPEAAPEGETQTDANEAPAAEAAEPATASEAEVEE
jgi:hypothetical protein